MQCRYFSFLFLPFLAMAGNIIPAIATTNAIISGVIVMQALNILNGKLDKCKTVSVQLKQDFLKEWTTADIGLHCAQC